MKARVRFGGACLLACAAAEGRQTVDLRSTGRAGRPAPQRLSTLRPTLVAVVTVAASVRQEAYDTSNKYP